MFARTRGAWCFGKVLYSPTSTLPSDFYRCCKEVCHMHLHADTFIGTRSSQHRGLFLSTEHGTLPANKPIATIPLASVYSVDNITAKPNTIRGITLDAVRAAIPNEEFKLMAPQLYLGLQFSNIIFQIPDVRTVTTAESMGLMEEVQASGVMPWARMLDDEDFNEEFVFGMYGMALDSWQRSSYEEMTKLLHLTLTALHDTFALPYPIEHLRRITRLVLARAEHLPPADYYDGSAFVRRWQHRLRRWRKQPDPAIVSMVPLLDLVNHSNRPNSGIRVGPSAVLGGKPAVTLFSLAPILPGQEICRHYNFALSRASALFRYGFLPFDLISIVDNDSFTENGKRLDGMLDPEAEETVRARERSRTEVARLEKIFQNAKKKSAEAENGAWKPNPAYGDRVPRRNE